MTASMRDFCFLSLTFVIIIDNISFTNETTMPHTIPPSIIVYAQQRQEQSPARNQESIDKQSNTKVLFTYSPKTPFVGGFTDLNFNVEDIKISFCFNGRSTREYII